MGKKLARKRGARRLDVTPELTANIRHRYEHSDERLAAMAAGLGCCTETVRAMARREGWVRYEPPPRDLSSAARLRVRAEQLAEQQSPLIPAEAGIQGHTEEPCHAAPGSPLSRGRAGDVLHPPLVGEGALAKRGRVRGRFAASHRPRMTKPRAMSLGLIVFPLCSAYSRLGRESCIGERPLRTT
jgi:hypothetical protein